MRFSGFLRPSLIFIIDKPIIKMLKIIKIKDAPFKSFLNRIYNVRLNPKRTMIVLNM
jgi:hypothetical protein